MNKIKAFFNTKVGKGVLVFLLAGAIGAATYAGCAPCVLVLENLRADVVAE